MFEQNVRRLKRILKSIPTNNPFVVFRLSQQPMVVGIHLDFETYIYVDNVEIGRNNDEQLRRLLRTRIRGRSSSTIDCLQAEVDKLEGDE